MTDFTVIKTYYSLNIGKIEDTIYISTEAFKKCCNEIVPVAMTPLISIYNNNLMFKITNL